MSGTLEQNIKVRIDTIINGLPAVQAFSKAIEKLKGGGGATTKLSFGDDASQAEKLAQSLEKLATATERINKQQPTGHGQTIRTVSSIVQGLAAAQLAIEFVASSVNFLREKGAAIFQIFGFGFGQIRKDATSAGHSIAQIGSHLDRTNTKAGQLGTQGSAGINIFIRNLSLLKGSAKDTGGSIASVDKEATTLAGGLSRLGAGFASTDLLAISLVGTLYGTVAALVLVGLGITALVALGTIALSPLLKFGVDFNSKIEQTKLGIGAIIASLAELRNASGQKLEGPEALNQALRLANDQVQKLKVDAINTVATFEQIAPAFQSAIGPGLAAGLTLDQIRKTTVQIVQAAGAIGLPMNQIAQEVRAILDGTINEDARLGKILGITNEMVKKWKEQGTLAEELNKRLATFTLAGVKAAETMDGLTSNLQEALNVFAGEATTQAFNTLKQKFLAILPQIFDFKNARLQQSFSALASLIDGIFVRAIGIAADFIQQLINGAQSVSRFVQANRQVLDQILDLVGRIIRQMIGLALETAKFLGYLLTSQSAVNLINLALNATLVTVRLLGPALRPFVDSLRGILGLLEAILAPSILLFSLLGSIGRGGGAPAATVSPFSPRVEQWLASLDETTLTPKPKVPGAGKGGGGGGGGGSQPEDTFDAALGFDNARAQSSFTLFKDLIDRETKVLEESFEKRTLSIRQFYEKLKRLQIAAIDADLKRIGTLRIAEQQSLVHSLDKIDKEKISDPEKEAKATNAINESLARYNALTVEAQLKVRERARVTEDANKKEEADLEALAKEFIDLDEQIASFEGLQSIDAIVERARPRIAKLKAELANVTIPDSVRASLQEQLDLVNKLVAAEIERARVANLLVVAQQKNAIIEGDISIILAKHSGNVLQEYRARLLIQPLVQQQIQNLQHALDLAERMAESQQDPQTIAALKSQIADLEEMKRRYRDVGQTIKDTLINSATQGFETLLLSMNDVIAGTKSIADAFRSFALSIIESIQQIIVKMIAMKIIMMVIGLISGGGSSSGSITHEAGHAFGAATGGEFSANPGGRIIRVAEAGHDELVVSTDPRFAKRTASLLGRFIKRTGILPAFGEFNSSAILSNIASRIPSFSAGDFVPASGPLAGAGEQNIILGGITLNFPNVRDHRDFQANKQSILRDAGRAVADATRNSRGSR